MKPRNPHSPTKKPMRRTKKGKKLTNVPPLSGRYSRREGTAAMQKQQQKTGRKGFQMRGKNKDI